MHTIKYSIYFKKYCQRVSGSVPLERLGAQGALGVGEDAHLGGDGELVEPVGGIVLQVLQGRGDPDRAEVGRVRGGWQHGLLCGLRLLLLPRLGAAEPLADLPVGEDAHTQRHSQDGAQDSSDDQNMQCQPGALLGASRKLSVDY